MYLNLTLSELGRLGKQRTLRKMNSLPSHPEVPSKEALRNVSIEGPMVKTSRKPDGVNGREGS